MVKWGVEWVASEPPQTSGYYNTIPTPAVFGNQTLDFRESKYFLRAVFLNFRETAAR